VEDLDNECMVEDTTQTTRPKIVCAISELLDQQLTTTTMTSADFKVLDDLTEDLLVASVRRLLNVPPISLCPNNEQFSSGSLDDSSIASSEVLLFIKNKNFVCTEHFLFIQLTGVCI